MPSTPDVSASPRMSAEDAEEWTQSLAQVGAGWWRQIALAARLDIPGTLGLSLEQWRDTRLGGLVLKSIPERREAVAELDEDGYADHEIAAILGVGERTVQRDLASIRAPDGAAQGEISEPASEERAPDGAAQGEISEPASEERAPDGAPSDPPLRTEDEQRGESPHSPEPEPAPRVQVNEGDEWYTPKWLFDALAVKFSIDVCAPLDQTHSAVPAERHFTIEDDGLAQPWYGTVWCNPPYSKPEPWARRMIHHGDGLLLTHMPMNAGWCVDTWDACDAIRLFQAMEFVRPDGSVQRPGYWLQLTAFGPVATEALARLQPLGEAAANKRRVASPMWRPVA